MMVYHIRLATEADLRPIIDALVPAFEGDPLQQYWIRNAEDKTVASRELMWSRIVGWVWPCGEIYTDEDRRGAACWLPIDLNLSPMTRLFRALRARATAPGRPGHYFVSVLGVHPGFQRSGLGTALAQPMLKRCEELGIAAAVGASNELNVPFYERLGFRVHHVMQEGPDGPTGFFMWREPDGGAL